MKLILRSALSLVLLLTISKAYGQGEFPKLLPHYRIAFQWSPDGTLYSAGNYSGDVQIFSNDGLLRTIEHAPNNAVYALAFSSDGSRLATGGDDNALRIWDVSDGAMLFEFPDLDSRVGTLSWSEDGTTIFVTLHDASALFISANISSNSYDLSEQIYVGFTYDSIWNNNDTLVAVGLPGSDVRLINTLNREISGDLDATYDVDLVNPPNEFTVSLAWHPRLNVIANGKINGKILIWDLDEPSTTVPVFSLEANSGATYSAVVPFEYSIVDIGFSADGHTLSSVSMDGTLRAWDVETGELLLDTNLGEQVLAGAFSPDGSQLVYSTYSATDVPPTLIDLPVLDANLPSGENK